MNTHYQKGFAFLELILIAAIIVVIGFLGYTAYNAFQKKNTTTASTTAATASTTVPAAPTITDASGLDQAMAALNQTDPSASTTDSTQLDSQMNF